MAQATLLPGVESISGKVGNFMFKTFKRNGKKEVRVYLCGPESYQRSTKVSRKEKRQRASFGEQSREVARRLKAGDKRPKKEIWAEVRAAFSTNAKV